MPGRHAWRNVSKRLAQTGTSCGVRELAPAVCRLGLPGRAPHMHMEKQISRSAPLPFLAFVIAKPIEAIEKNSGTTYDIRWLGNSAIVFDRFEDEAFPQHARIWKVSIHADPKVSFTK